MLCSSDEKIRLPSDLIAARVALGQGKQRCPCLIAMQADPNNHNLP